MAVLSAKAITMDERLRNAVENAYGAFQTAIIGQTLEVCRCAVCFGGAEEAERILVQTPLREITAAQLAVYTNSAHGWHDDMLYFLPRYLELLALGEVPAWFETDYCLARLSEVDWREIWPVTRREALDGFFCEYLSAAFSNAHLISLSAEAKTMGYYDYTDLRSAITLVANAGADLGVLSGILQVASGAMPALATAVLIIESSQELTEGILDWALIGTSAPQRLARWLTGTTTASKLRDAQALVVEPIERATLSLAISTLVSLNQSGDDEDRQYI